MRYREVKCLVGGKEAKDEDCEDIPRPQDFQTCDMGSCRTDLWFYSDWSTYVSYIYLI